MLNIYLPFFKDKIKENSTDNDLESIRLESEAVQLAEQHKYDDALVLFDQAIKISPERSSLYNNRAQTYRLIGNDDGKLKKRIYMVF